MKRVFSFHVVFAFSALLSSCADYVPFGFWEDRDEERNVNDGVYGRLWVNPNPVHFPPVPEGEPMAYIPISVSNIGEGVIRVSGVELSGDSDFTFPPGIAAVLPVLEDAPYVLDGDTGCYGFECATIALEYRPLSGLPASAKITFRTDDPDNPTLVVPVLASEEGYIPDFARDPAYGTLPIVRPNPVRFDVARGDQEQSIEMCLHLFCPKAPSTITEIEPVGNRFSIGELTDMTGNIVHLPVTYQVESMDLNYLTVTYRPTPGDPEDGALRVVFIDDQGEERILLVPILFR